MSIFVKQIIRKITFSIFYFRQIIQDTREHRGNKKCNAFHNVETKRHRKK